MWQVKRTPPTHYQGLADRRGSLKKIANIDDFLFSKTPQAPDLTVFSLWILCSEKSFIVCKTIPTRSFGNPLKFSGQRFLWNSDYFRILGLLITLISLFSFLEKPLKRSLIILSLFFWNKIVGKRRKCFTNTHQNGIFL